MTIVVISLSNVNTKRANRFSVSDIYMYFSVIHGSDSQFPDLCLIYSQKGDF